MILRFEAIDYHFFKIDQRDIFASPVPGLITGTIYWTFFFLLEKNEDY
jgi:hypothetical protein